MRRRHAITEHPPLSLAGTPHIRQQVKVVWEMRSAAAAAAAAGGGKGGQSVAYGAILEKVQFTPARSSRCGQHAVHTISFKIECCGSKHIIKGCSSYAQGTHDSRTNSAMHLCSTTPN
jgi:hypothetical protein